MTSSRCVYVIKLRPSTNGDSGRLVGRLEHVPSGRRHEFDGGDALLACLAQEQARVARDLAAEAVPAAGAWPAMHELPRWSS
jgi:hypothetical protein